MQKMLLLRMTVVDLKEGVRAVAEVDHGWMKMMKTLLGHD